MGILNRVIGKNFNHNYIFLLKLDFYSFYVKIDSMQLQLLVICNVILSKVKNVLYILVFLFLTASIATFIISGFDSSLFVTGYLYVSKFI